MPSSPVLDHVEAPAYLLEIRHLRAFVAVAEELHFTRAAQRIHTTQQSLSAHIAQLETRLGTQLFVRTTRVVELTRAGEELLERARPILGLVNEAWEETRRAYHDEHDRLRIAYTPTVGGETLPRVLDGLHANYPNVRVSAVEVWLQEAMHGLASRQFDVAFVRCPGVTKGFAVELVRKEPLCVTLAASHALSHAQAADPRDLANYLLTIWPRTYSPALYDLIAGAFSENFARGNVYEFENFSRGGFLRDTFARTEIAAGRAFSVHYGARTAPPEGFVFQRLEPAPQVGLHLIYRPDQMTTAVGDLITVVHDVAKAAEWRSVAQASPIG